MKKIIPAVVLLAAVSCSLTKKGDVKPNRKYQINWSNFNLKGKVKSIKEFNFKQYVPFSELTYYVSKEDFQFDTAGHLLEQTTYLENETFSIRHTYQHDKAGNYIVKISFAKDSSIKSKVTYEYDEAGNMMQAITYDRAGTVKMTDTYRYDERGDVIEWQASPNGIVSKYKSTYDSRGRLLIKEDDTQFGGSSNDHARKTYRYNGDTIEESRSGRYAERILTVNNRDQKPVWRKRIDPDGSFFMQAFKYDSLGNQTGYIEQKSENIDDRHSYRYEYVYDNKGNWIKRTTTKLDGRLITSVERKLEYY